MYGISKWLVLWTIAIFLMDSTSLPVNSDTVNPISSATNQGPLGLQEEGLPHSAVGRLLPGTPLFIVTKREEGQSRVWLREVNEPPKELKAELVEPATSSGVTEEGALCNVTVGGGTFRTKLSPELRKGPVIIQKATEAGFRLVKIFKMPTGVIVKGNCRGEDIIHPDWRDKGKTLARLLLLGADPWMYEGSEILIEGELTLFGIKMSSVKEYPLTLRFHYEGQQQPHIVFLKYVCGRGAFDTERLGEKDTVHLWIPYLTSKEAFEREAAAQALGWLGNLEPQNKNSAVQALLGALKDTNPRVRMYAAEALGRLKAREAVNALKQLSDPAQEKDTQVREVAAEALKKIR